MNKLKKIAIGFLWFLLIAGVITSFSFSRILQKQVSIADTNISFTDKREFITKENINNLLRNKNFLYPNKIDSVSLLSIEEAIKKNPFCKKAEVHKTLDGKINITIWQREPLLRIFDKNNQSYYLDVDGKKLPISNTYTERLLIANNLPNTEVNHNTSLITNLKGSKKEARKNVFLELYTLGKYIKSDNFWNAQITQIYVNDKNEFELYTLAGNQKIIFGNLKNMQNKFQKLFSLYKDGFSKTGWDKYKTIDVRFDNQIVCKK